MKSELNSLNQTFQNGEECSELEGSDKKTNHEAQDAKRLFKIWPVYEYFLQKFRSIYNPKNCQLMKPQSHGRVA
jgi:hypothetical protein